MLAIADRELAGGKRRRQDLFELCFAAGLLGLAALNVPVISSDSPQYIAMAEGRFSDVVAPFSDRILAPLLSGWLKATFGLSVAAGFSAVALAGAALFVGGIHILYRQYQLEPYALFPAMLGLPWVIGTIRDAYLPDILVMGLTCLFLLALRKQSLPLAAVAAVLLVMARETGLVLVLVAVVSASRQRHWAFAAALAAVSVGAFVAVKHLSHAAPNVHEMNGLLYMALKVPVNFLRNVAGVEFWANDMNWCNPPVFTFAVGRAIAPYVGKITTVGICAGNPMAPVATAAVVLSTFGVLPGLMLALASDRAMMLARDRWILLVAIYGGLMFVLGICTGASVYRLVTYGWPLFIFVAPVLWKAEFGTAMFDRGPLMAAQLGLSWLGPILGATGDRSEWWWNSTVAAAVALSGIVLNGWAYYLVVAERKRFGAHNAAT